MKKILAGGLLVFSSLLHAQDDYNACANLSVAITNTTEKPCLLIKKTHPYGIMISNSMIPTYLAAHMYYVFEMAQWGYGPDITLTYQCGADHDITFRTQQDYCLLNRGDITAVVLKRHKLNAVADTELGSYFFGYHGSVSWTITSVD